MISSKNITISTAAFSDLTEILELQKEAYIQEAKIYNDYNIQPLTQDMDSLEQEWQNGTIIKAEINGQIVGSVRAVLADDICKIGKFIVKPDFQNMGIGKLLMAEIEKRFNHCNRYALFTGYKSDKNLTLYQKLGYTIYKEEQIEKDLKLIYLQKICIQN